MTANQAYRVLGLAPGCTERDLTRRFRHLAHQTHPDAGGSNEQFSELAHAYSVAVQDQIPRVADVVITTHVTSVSGRFRSLRRRARHRLHQLTTTSLHDHNRSTGGHQ